MPQSSFENLDDLATHIADRISLKTTTQTFSEVIERTGGRETIRVRNIEAQLDALPLRREYETDVAEPLQALRQERVASAREAYQTRKREIAESALSLEERLEAGRDALREMRAAVAAIYREIRPQSFGDWLRVQAEQGKRATPRGHSQHQEHTQERSFTQAELGAQKSEQEVTRFIPR